MIVSALLGSSRVLSITPATTLAILVGTRLGLVVPDGDPEGRPYFVNVQQVGEEIRALIEQHKPRGVALDMSRVPDIEYSTTR